MCLECLFQALLLLVIANGAPIIGNLIWHQRYASPVDAGAKLCDGHPLFGASKTWRGLMVSIGLTVLAADLLGINWLTGICFALLAMAGDLLSSFLKRRRGLPSSTQVRGLDTVPESVLPTSLLKEPLGLGWLDIVIIAACFLLMEEFLSPLLYKLHIRKHPF